MINGLYSMKHSNQTNNKRFVLSKHLFKAQLARVMATLSQQANLTKFLSVYADEHLTREHHISFICGQISKSVGIIISIRSRFYLSSKTKVTFYYALIYPYIT